MKYHTKDGPCGEEEATLGSVAIFVGVSCLRLVKIYLQCLRLFFEESLKNANKKISPADRKKIVGEKI